MRIEVLALVLSIVSLTFPSLSCWCLTLTCVVTIRIVDKEIYKYYTLRNCSILASMA
jgi:hypothetical protein